MVPQTKVFVGSLPQGSKPEDLRKLFERFGVVTECDIMNRCGFVHMQTEEQAGAAIRGLNNSTFNGGVISVERGRIKERGAGRGGRGGRGGMRGGGGGVERRAPGGPMRRDAPYMREARPAPHLARPAPAQPMGLRNGGMGGGYDRGMDRAMGGYDERYGGYGEDRRGFALMDRAREYAPMYEERRYGAPDDMPLYSERRLYPDERDLMERRRPPAPPYDRAPAQRPPPMGNGDMFSRRSPMRGGAPVAGGYERDPYAQQYPPMGRGGGAARGRDLGGAMGPRRY